jgi:hypothetical protein
MLRPGFEPRISDSKKEKRDRTIRIRTYDYERLANLEIFLRILTMH